MTISLNFRKCLLVTIVLLSIASCSPEALAPSPPGIVITTQAKPESTAVATETPLATAPAEGLALGPMRPPPSGLVFRDQNGLWLIDENGQPRLLASQPDSVPSPDLSHAYLWDYETNTVTLIDLQTGTEEVITPEVQLNGLFAWGDNQTILLGLYISPEESDGPNYGHLASLDVASGLISTLDEEQLMSSAPALSPDTQAIAYSSLGPMLFTLGSGVQPFPSESFTGLTRVKGLISPAWAPDGQQIAWIVFGGPFSEDPEVTMGLAIYDLESKTAALRLAFDPARWGATPPPAVWSPDGRWLALRVYANGPEGSGIWLLSADGEQEIYLPGIAGNANYPVWSPDSRELIYFDYADEDEPPYAEQLIYDLESHVSYPLSLDSGLGILWLDKWELQETTAADPLCMEVPRPALLFFDGGEYTATNVESGETCQFHFPGQLPGLIQSGGDAIYYHEIDTEDMSAVVMQTSADGTAVALPFTEIKRPAQFLHYIVSPDGHQVVWSASRPGAAGEPVSDLWLAGTDGSGMVQLLDAVPAGDNRFIVPIRFSPDGQTLYYALQPIGIGGSWTSFNGRYDSLYGVSVGGGQSNEIFQCPAENILCLGDFTGNSDELLLAYTDTSGKSILVSTIKGEIISLIDFPESDFTGYPTFGPGGQLAFYTATLGEHADGYPIPESGTLYTVQPPYDGDPQVAINDESVATLLNWLDGQHLIYNSVAKDGSWGMAVTALSGSGSNWEVNPAQFITILR